MVVKYYSHVCGLQRRIAHKPKTSLNKISFETLESRGSVPLKTNFILVISLFNSLNTRS